MAAFVIGGLAGSLALFWSVIAPVLAIALVVLGVLNARRHSRGTGSHAWVPALWSPSPSTALTTPT